VTRPKKSTRDQTEKRKEPEGYVAFETPSTHNGLGAIVALGPEVAVCNMPLGSVTGIGVVICVSMDGVPSRVICTQIGEVA